MRSILSIFGSLLLLLLASCSTQKQIDKQASRLLYNSDALKSAHVGISVYNDSSKTYLYNYQGNKFFYYTARNCVISVNPFDIQELADSIHAALTMAPSERQRRIDGLKRIVTARSPGDWIDDQLADIREKAASGAR